jgi:amidophosphoribosyltransferase
MRELSVSLKLNALRSQVEGKRIVLVDDSIVRGTTSKKIVQMMKKVGGAKEVHMRISSPPVKHSCYYGVDTPDKEVLIANRMSLEGIAELIGADSLGFISNEGLKQTPVGAKCGFCSACFDGNYPLEV